MGGRERKEQTEKRYIIHAIVKSTMYIIINVAYLLDNWSIAS